MRRLAKPLTGLSPCPGVRIPPSPPMRPRPGPVYSFLPLLALAAAGCAERTLRVETEPPGARVWVDGVAVGTSPVEVPFTHYGAREIEARTDGFAPATTVVELDPPLWSRFPFDLFLEVLLPVRRVDARLVRLALVPARVPATQAEVEAALGRAKALRSWSPDRPIPPGRTP